MSEPTPVSVLNALAHDPQLHAAYTVGRQLGYRAARNDFAEEARAIAQRLDMAEETLRALGATLVDRGNDVRVWLPKIGSPPRWRVRLDTLREVATLAETGVLAGTEHGAVCWRDALAQLVSMYRAALADFHAGAHHAPPAPEGAPRPLTSAGTWPAPHTPGAPMKVRAKFKVVGEKRTAWSLHRQVELMAVYGTQGENADFAAATPNGRIELTIDPSTPAIDGFPLGQEFYVEFTPVPAAAPESPAPAV